MTEITVKNAVNALNVQNTAPNVKSVMSVPITKERIARNTDTVKTAICVTYVQPIVVVIAKHAATVGLITIYV